jgi:hypothetical protein
MSVLLFGCETWKATQEIINKLQTFVLSLQYTENMVAKDYN